MTEVNTISKDLLTDIKDLLESTISEDGQLQTTITESQSSTAPSATPITIPTTAGGTDIIAANANRISVTLQNVGTTPCLIRLGGNPSTSAFNAVLSADTDIRAGKGGSIEIRDYTGAIKGITEANSTSIVVTEITKS